MAQDQSLHGLVVLVVEDDADTLSALARLITDAFGCRVLSARSCDEALRIIDSALHVDLLFSDVVMPGKDGLTLAHLVRRRLPDLPVVLATGRPDVVDSLAESGAVALIKPYSIERLEAVFTEQLRIEPAPRKPDGAGGPQHTSNTG